MNQILFVLALVCFALAAFRVQWILDFLALGLFLWVLSAR